MFTVNSTGLMVTQGLGFAVAGGLGQVMPAHDVIALVGVLGLVAVLGLGSRRSRSRLEVGLRPDGGQTTTASNASLQ